MRLGVDDLLVGEGREVLLGEHHEEDVLVPDDAGGVLVGEQRVDVGAERRVERLGALEVGRGDVHEDVRHCLAPWSDDARTSSRGRCRSVSLPRYLQKTSMLVNSKFSRSPSARGMSRAQASPVPWRHVRDDALAHAHRRPRRHARELRADIWLAGALLLGAILSAALGSVAGVYGDEHRRSDVGARCTPSRSPPPRRAPALPRGRRGRWWRWRSSSASPSASRRSTSATSPCSSRMYTVGAWVDDRRRATIVRVLIIVGMFLWLLITTFQSATADTDERTLARRSVLAVRGVHADPVPRQRRVLRRRVLHGRPRLRLRDGARGAAGAHRRTRAGARAHRRPGRRARPRADRARAARRRRPPRLGDGRAGGRGPRGARAGSGCRARGARWASRSSARSALAELRHLLETLRTLRRRRPERVDRPPLGACPQLVEHARENGLPTDAHVVGEPVELPDLVQVNTYRIAQEALTNARRHGGPDAAADVRLRYGARRRRARSHQHRARRLARPAGPRDRGDAGARRGIGRHDRGRSARARRLPRAGADPDRAGAEVLA